jgi:DhnA family fructose-bisphosphate aldolase class Ia
MAYDVVQARAAGITFGRNIWQSERISGMIRALKLVVHSHSSVKEALDNLAAE